VSAEPRASVTCSGAAILLLLFASAPVLAHRLDVEAHVVDGQVLVEALYSHGEPVPEAAVEVTDPDGNVLIEGQTDAKGTYRFTLTAIPAHINVVVKTNDGHRGSTTLPREDLLGLVSAADAPTTAAANTEVDDLAEITAALRRHELALQDIQQQLARLNRTNAGVSTDRVLAGIGFIVGLTGVAAYCLARRPRQN
jgi:nickel transport protein